MVSGLGPQNSTAFAALRASASTRRLYPGASEFSFKLSHAFAGVLSQLCGFSTALQIDQRPEWEDLGRLLAAESWWSRLVYVHSVGSFRWTLRTPLGVSWFHYERSCTWSVSQWDSETLRCNLISGLGRHKSAACEALGASDSAGVYPGGHELSFEPSHALAGVLSRL